ncbi:Tetratricopeptide repeat-containing protein [Colwellia chukchiensis]|uniref:Tetratricopeptide repeat-containing protein n=1 Tax=Colwellia chukchiensis TaxID=641665 RepID=A0A1H7GK78_9GAMM|nr:tetratricopeptide repeat protein [Colwellia chukchiensis]SEK38566.1 Tetratricopeptide repeat-containing protein [Colwellia chukchiensis]
MSKVNAAAIAGKLQQLFALLQKGEAKTVINELNTLLEHAGASADILHLLAMAYKADSQTDKAISYFNQSLAINDKQAQVHNNLANTYKQSNNHQLAEKHYRQAIQLNPNYLDAYKNLGLLHFANQAFAQAKTNFQQVIALAKHDVSAITSLANIYKAQEDFQNAVKYYQQALAINPNYVNALHNLGVAYRMQGDFANALSCFKKAQAIAPNIAELDYNEANTQFDIGNFQAAEQAYWRALQKAPDNCEVHETLNEFYWQIGKKDQFGKSFKMAIEHLPSHSALRHAYAESLLSSGHKEQALQVVEQALSLAQNPELLHLKGKLLATMGELANAITWIETSLDKQYKLTNALDLIELLIIVGDYEKALQRIAHAEKIAPHNQLLIAYKSVCWRLTDDARYLWLIDYQKHIQTYDIPVPKGYSSRAMFLEELQGVLLTMHQTQHAPLKQTLRFGTQTPGRLFHNRVQQIMELKSVFAEVVQEYISSLPSDDSHPLLSRKRQQFSFAGSWSVKLKPNGFHVNHVHPAGWLSSSFYVNVPDFSHYPQTSEHAGAIKFGESAMNLQDREKISRIVTPKAGLVAIFPSYVWHGTFAFNGPDDIFRLTAPCDITPV